MTTVESTLAGCFSVIANAENHPLHILIHISNAVPTEETQIYLSCAKIRDEHRMGYYWLNHRKEDESGYRDIEGEVYHYRSTVAGSKKFSEGDWFVYYRPGEHVLFGAGCVAEIEVIKETEESNNAIAAEVQPNVPATRSLTEYLAHMENHRPFEPPVSARKIKEDISFLQGKTGLSGVPQNSIYSIDREDYLTILRAAGEEDLLNY